MRGIWKYSALPRASSTPTLRDPHWGPTLPEAFSKARPPNTEMDRRSRMKMTLVRKVSATWFSRGPTLRPAGSHQASEGPSSKSPDVTTKASEHWPWRSSEDLYTDKEALKRKRLSKGLASGPFTSHSHPQTPHYTPFSNCFIIDHCPPSWQTGTCSEHAMERTDK